MCDSFINPNGSIPAMLFRDVFSTEETELVSNAPEQIGDVGTTADPIPMTQLLPAKPQQCVTPNPVILRPTCTSACTPIVTPCVQRPTHALPAPARRVAKRRVKSLRKVNRTTFEIRLPRKTKQTEEHSLVVKSHRRKKRRHTKIIGITSDAGASQSGGWWSYAPLLPLLIIPPLFWGWWNSADASGAPLVVVQNHTKVPVFLPQNMGTRHSILIPNEHPLREVLNRTTLVVPAYRVIEQSEAANSDLISRAEFLTQNLTEKFDSITEEVKVLADTDPHGVHLGSFNQKVSDFNTEADALEQLLIANPTVFSYEAPQDVSASSSSSSSSSTMMTSTQQVEQAAA